MITTPEQSLFEIQKYLRSGKSLDDFHAEYGISGKQSDNLIILDYDQLAVKWDQPYGYAARGLILDSTTFEPVAFGLAKFKNFGEPGADEIDWDSAVVFEKIDGSLVNRFWHDDQWKYTTRFQLPSDTMVNQVNDFSMTWKQLIDKCFANVELDQPKDETWAFEICSPLNMVVVRHDAFYVKLLARRSLKDLREIPVNDHALAPRAYRFSSAEEVAKFANTFPATSLEGFVVCDKNFKRIKIKSDEYVNLHRLKDGLRSIKSLLLMARSNDYEEVVVHFPAFKDDLDKISNLIENSILEHDKIYHDLSGAASQKEFALSLQAKKPSFPAVLFNVRAGKFGSVREAFEGIDENAFVRMFKDKAKSLIGEKYTTDDA